jgi:DNA modification methylase
MKKRRASTSQKLRTPGRSPSRRPRKDPFETLVIQSPKRTQDALCGWNGFFPYYAGYADVFARSLLQSAGLPKRAVVLDPWNGSGTTTFAASQLGVVSQGFDLNPVMLIVARARLLARSEADSLEPLARKIVKGLRGNQSAVKTDDPLLDWFTLPTVGLVRALERRIREHLLGEMTLSAEGLKLENLSGLAATFYVALFSVCRHLTVSYQSSNPTWLRKPRKDERVINSNREAMLSMFVANLKSMGEALSTRTQPLSDVASVDLSIIDTTSATLPKSKIDFILTSPPYCTRIDYAAATRIELAILHPLLGLRMEDLGRRMIGSTRVPPKPISRNTQWGQTCNRFLAAVKKHPSRASEGYYYKTHLDYFDKMHRSMTNLGAMLKDGGRAILVVQDSYYKDVHNDLAKIVTEIGNGVGLRLGRRDDFHFSRSMAGVNPHSRTYRRVSGVVESVLSFQRC